jgi:hypothetical protein
MKRFSSALVVLLFASLGTASRANDLYVAQSALGAANGSSAANAIAVASLNYSSLNPGDTLHLCGVISNSLGGANGITIRFEPNAKWSNPASRAFFLDGLCNLTVDGGSNGIVENTDCGTALGHQTTYSAFDISGCSNITIENLHINNLYVHSSANDSGPSIASCGGIYANGLSGANYFCNLSFSNVGWGISILGSPASMTASNCSFVNYDHGIVPGGTNVLITQCDFGSTGNWDTTNNVYHHDGVHYFGTTNFNACLITRCIFHGNWGSNNTSFIYMEGDGIHGTPPNTQIFNNIFLPTNYLNDGMVFCAGPNCQIMNNSFVGSGITLSSALTTGGAGTVVVNNISSGVDNFIYCTGNGPVLFSNNIYANPAPGGNAPFCSNTTSFATLAQWQSAVGDAHSLFTTSAAVNPDGTVPAGSPAVGAGANLTPLFKVDYVGNLRTNIGPWVAGAYTRASARTILSAPSNFRLVSTGAVVVPTNTSTATPASATLAAEWAFDEGAGSTAADLSGNGDAGTLVNNPAWVPGQNNQGYALSFNGVNQYMQVPGPLSSFASFTYSCWINCGAQSSSTILANGYIGFAFYSGNAHHVAFVTDGSYYDGAAASNVVDDGQWHLLAGTCDGANLTIYVDGAQAGTCKVAGINAGGNLYVGWDNGAYFGYFNGTVDDVRVYSGVLSSNQVSALYSAGPM